MITWPLHGERVTLRPFVAGDVTDTYIGWLNDASVTRFSNQRFHRHDRATSLAYLDGFRDSTNLFLSVRRQVDDVAIGTMTVYRAVHHGTADVGIMIGDPDSWGSGWGSDAWTTLIAALLTDSDIRKLTAGCARTNRGMIQLMERAGMALEATRRAHELIDGEPTDILLYARFANH